MATKKALEPKTVSTWITSISLLAIVVLAIIDMLLSEQVPIIVYGIIGGIALGADKDSLSTILGREKP